MAEDIRKALKLDPNSDKAFSGEQWNDAAPSYKAPENANLLPGGTQHTAGGKEVEDITMVDAAKSIKREDWSQFTKKPCVRDSLLLGIGSGFAVGSVRAIWKAPVWIACNWAVGAFCASSFVKYQYCNYQRLAEKEGMQRAMEIIDRKQIERKQKEARMERAKELRRQKKDEEHEQHFAKLRDEKTPPSPSGSDKPWYKVW